MADINCYIEKVHIYDGGHCQQIILVVFKFQMFFIFMNNDTFYMKPINIKDDIKKFIVCDMIKNKVDKI